MQTSLIFRAKNLRQLLTDGLQPVFRHSGDNDWQLVKGEIGMLRMPAAWLRQGKQGFCADDPKVFISYVIRIQISMF